MIEQECNYCVYFGLDSEGFVCKKTERPVSKDDTCNDWECVE